MRVYPSLKSILGPPVHYERNDMMKYIYLAVFILGILLGFTGVW